MRATPPTTAARVTDEEMLALRRHHLGRMQTSEAPEAVEARFRYWLDLGRRAAERRFAAPERRWQSYTHDAEGNLIRLG